MSDYPAAPVAKHAPLAEVDALLERLERIEARLAVLPRVEAAIAHLDRRLGSAERALSHPTAVPRGQTPPPPADPLPSLPVPDSPFHVDPVDDEGTPLGEPSVMVPVEEVVAQLNASSPRIECDFNSEIERGLFWLRPEATGDLRAGTRVVLSDGEIEVEGFLERRGEAMVARSAGKFRDVLVPEDASLQGRASVIRPPRPDERFKDRSMIVICPTRGAIPTEVCETWPSLAWPMNQRRNGPMFAKGYDVASAYNALIAGILEHPILKSWKYVFTFEDDNILPYDAPLRLMETMEAGPQGDPEGAVDFQGRPLVQEWAGVSGIYFTKDALHSPMAYGDPVSYRKTGKTNYYPVDLSAVKEGQHLIECNGIAMGCALWRLDYFRRVPGPWFMTVEDRIMVNGQLLTPDEAQPFVEADPQGDFKKLATQDIYWAERAVREVGARFVVDLRVHVGHLDTSTGRIF